MSSPQDSAVDMKKRKRLAALQNQSKQAAAKKEQEKQATVGILGVADCDIGASPQITKGSVFSKGGKMSPIVRADRFKLGKRKE
mmetsp:Transcript_4630/g.7853  ORF Transcript_4630/g.7853 Transcript_4630/m.7853 type:complete len:84 (+) Transcript_4630:271-522(+)